MNIRNSIIAAALALGTLTAVAVPALPGYHNIKQPDGSYVRAKIIGDEHFHYYETENGDLMMADATGRLTKVSQAQVTKARDIALDSAESEGLMRVNPRPINPKFPTTGKVTGLILLVEYQDVKLTKDATVDHYKDLCNKPNLESNLTTGSVLDYFTAQSSGKFTPEFDVFGPLTLPHERAYYGLTTNGLVDQFRDACLEADKKGLDFSKYDINEDGLIDFLFIIYAGHGEAQGGPAESVWPAMLDLSNYVFDWFDGLQPGVAACSCELKGATGTDLDGIGTICHEFSHILGLADIYDTTQQSGYGMAHYDIMDIGSYNDAQKTPSGYTAMDKFTLGWIEPMVMEGTMKDVRLEPFDTSHQAAFIVNPANRNEYFTLENRQQQNWDKGIPGHGLVISYCHYEKKYWDRNTLNAPSSAAYEHVKIVAADNSWESTPSNEAGDPFPGTRNRTSFSAKTRPSAVWMSSNTKATFEVSNIREQEDGSILFDFTADTTGINDAIAEGSEIYVLGNSIVAPEGASVYSISGQKVGKTSLPAGIYIVKTAGKTVKISI